MNASYRNTLIAAASVFAVSLGSSAQATEIYNTVPIARHIERQTHVPVLLPPSMPDSLVSRGVYARIRTVSDRGYVVDLVTTKSCGRSGPCFIGTVSGADSRPPSELPLSTYAFAHNTYWYSVRIPGASAYSIRVLAQSMQRY